MRIKKIIISAISCFLLLAVGIGIEDIYCAYFHGSGGLTLLERSSLSSGGLIIIDPYAAPEDTAALSDWAKKNGAALAVIGDSPGIAVCDHSGHIKKLLEKAGADKAASPLDESMNGVYVTNDTAYICAYVENGIFMPGTLSMPVLGYYDEAKLPEDLRRPFFYPLSAMAGKGQYYLTDADDISGLVQFLKQDGSTDEISVQSAGISIGRFLSLLVHDPVETRSRTTILYALISLSLCFIFSGLMLYREHRRELVIRHLFGMSVGKMIKLAIMITAAITAAALLLFLWSALSVDYVQLDNGETALLACIVAAVFLLLGAIVNTAGMLGIIRMINRGMRYEDNSASE